MSLHQHVNSLNALGSRLTDNIVRLQNIADSVGGPTPESGRDRGARPQLSTHSLDGRFTNVVMQYEETLAHLTVVIDRLENMLLDNGPKIGTAGLRDY